MSKPKVGERVLYVRFGDPVGTGKVVEVYEDGSFDVDWENNAPMVTYEASEWGDRIRLAE